MIELRPIEESVAYQQIWAEGFARGMKRGMILGELKVLEEFKHYMDPAEYEETANRLRKALVTLE